MKIIKIYDLTFKRTAKFAPEQYEVYDNSGDKLASLELKWGTLTMRINSPKLTCDMLSSWAIPDLNCFHTEERRNKWLTEAAEKLMEVLELYGQSSVS